MGGAAEACGGAAASACDTDSSGRTANFYDGESASCTYDERFANGPDIPKSELDAHIPRGAATWSNWDGSGDDLLLVTAYRDGQDAHIIGIDPVSEERVGTVAIAESHVGGIAVSNGWAFVRGRGSTDRETIRKYRLSEIKAAMTASGPRPSSRSARPATSTAPTSPPAMTGTCGGGRFNGTGRDEMYSYEINDDGSLTPRTRCTRFPPRRRA